MIQFHDRTIGWDGGDTTQARFCDAESGLFLVAVGRGTNGFLATSQILWTFEERARDLGEWARQCRDVLDQYHVTHTHEALDEAFQNASQRAFEDGRNNADVAADLSAVLLGDGVAFLAHVGATRIYLLRDGRAEQITRAHVVSESLKETGFDFREDTLPPQYMDVLSRGIGIRPTVDPDIHSMDLLPGDRLLLSSTGFRGRMSDDELYRCATLESLEEATAAVVEAATTASALRDLSVVLIEPPANPQAEAMLEEARAMGNFFLFEGLSFQSRLQVNHLFGRQPFTAGETIVREGERGRTMYVVVQGEVAVFRGDQEVTRLGPGEHFGELALADDSARAATVTGVTDGRLLTVDRDRLNRFFQRKPDLGIPMLWKLVGWAGHQLQMMSDRMVGIPEADEDQ